MKNVVAVAVTAVAACSPSPAPSRPVSPAVPSSRVVVMISAQTEWKALAFAGELHTSPYGPWMFHQLGNMNVVFFHGGYGKVQAAGSTQYVIDTFHPELVINLGTAGGFGDGIAVGDIVMATRTVIYDIVERMGDPDEAIADFATDIDTRTWPARLATSVKPAPLVSGDQDLAPDMIDRLRMKYHAPAGDWESGAIALVATHNHVRVLILRAVTDIVGAAGDVTYNNTAAWAAETKKAMAKLVALAADALPDLVSRD